MSLATPAVSHRDVGGSPGGGSRFLSSVQSPVALTPGRKVSFQRIGSWQAGSSWQPSNPYIFSSSNGLPRVPMSEGIKQPDLITTTGSSCEQTSHFTSKTMGPAWPAQQIAPTVPTPTYSISQGYDYYQPQPEFYQTEAIEAPSVLVIAIQGVEQLIPMDERVSFSRPSRLRYEIIPFATMPSDRPDQVNDFSGDHLGPFNATPVTAPTRCWRLDAKSTVLRVQYEPDMKYFLKMVECTDETRRDLGVVSLTLSANDVDIPMTPLNVVPEQIINRPEYRRYFTVHGADATDRGVMVLGMVFDYLRPGEALWPSEAYYEAAEANVVAKHGQYARGDYTMQYAPLGIVHRNIAANQSYPSPRFNANDRRHRLRYESLPMYGPDEISWMEFVKVTMRDFLDAFNLCVEIRKELC